MPFTSRQFEINQLQRELGKSITDFNLTPRQREIQKLKSELGRDKVKEEMGFLENLIRPITAIPEVFSEGLEQIQKPGILNKLGGAASIAFSPALGPARAIGEGAEAIAEGVGFEEETAKGIGTGADILSSLLIPGSIFSAGKFLPKIIKFFSRRPRLPRDIREVSKMEQDIFRISGGKRTNLQRTTFVDDMQEILEKSKFKPGPIRSLEETRLGGIELGMTAENMEELFKRVPFDKLSKYIDAATTISIKTMNDFRGVLDKLPKNIITEASDESLAVALNSMFKVYSVAKTVSTFKSEVGRALRQSSRLKPEELSTLFKIQQGIKKCQG